MTLKKIVYWSSYIIPGRPTLALISEYMKPKEKRNKIILTAGYVGTIFLVGKLVLGTAGIITFDKIINKIKEKRENTLEQKVQEKESFIDENIYFYKKTKHL